MPRKIRELIRDLERAGFSDRGGKGSHRNFVHPKVAKPVGIAGNPGDDAKHYQERIVRRAHRGGESMKESARYSKIVEWSEEDQCFIGSCPGLFYGGCHGPDEKQAFEELCQMVEEVIQLYHEDRKTLPPPTSGRDLANHLTEIA